MGCRREFLAGLTDALCACAAYMVEWHIGSAGNEVRREGETKAELFERFGQADKIPPEPNLPAVGAYLWGWFVDLSSRRLPGMDITPIVWSELRAWQELRRLDIRPEEVDVILSIDVAYREAMANRDKIEPAQSVSASILKEGA